MRRLSVIIALGASIAVAAIAQPTLTEATHIQVFGFLFHPTGGSYGSSTYDSWLACGWHDNCDGSFNDPAKVGLDWIWPNQNITMTRLRLKLIGPSVNTNVAWGRSFNVGGDCPYMDIEFRRYGDNAYYGFIRHQHAEGPTGTTYYTWVAGPGVQYDYLMGSFVDHYNDDCSSYNHVMQWYTLGLAGNILSKNANIPNESGCFHCNLPYSNPWSPAEYIFGFAY